MHVVVRRIGGRNSHPEFHRVLANDGAHRRFRPGDATAGRLFPWLTFARRASASCPTKREDGRWGFVSPPGGRWPPLRSVPRRYSRSRQGPSPLPSMPGAHRNIAAVPALLRRGRAELCDDEGRRKLLLELGKLRPGGVYFRAHNLLNTGDGTPAFKWGSTNVYTETKDGKPVYDWTGVDRIIDTYLARGVRPISRSASCQRLCRPRRRHAVPAQLAAGLRL